MRLLVAGVSVRALAASVASSRSARERFPEGILALDYFGDADLLALASRHGVRVVALQRDLGLPRTLDALGRAALGLDWEAVVYAGGLENRPALLRRLSRRGAILGNGPAEVSPARDPAILFPFLERQGIPHAPSFPARTSAPRVAGATRYLWKPLRSGGGARVGMAAPGQRRPPGHRLQKFLPGPVGSAAILADGRDAVVLGVTEQIVGWSALGGSGFRYGGNIAGPARDLLPRGGLAILSSAAAALACRFGLRGLFGIDFVLSEGVPRLIEVNPRYTASMELFEEIAGRNLFDLHLAALEGGALPRGPLPPAGSSAPRFRAKGILYARDPVRCGPPEGLLALGCRDVPIEGETIGAGQPICTLLARGESTAACRESLARGAQAALARLDRAQTPGLAAFPGVRRSW